MQKPDLPCDLVSPNPLGVPVVWSQNRLQPQVAAFPPVFKFLKLQLPLGSLVPIVSSSCAYLLLSGVFGTVCRCGEAAMSNYKHRCE